MSTQFDRDTAVRRRPVASHDERVADRDDGAGGGGADHDGASASAATAAATATTTALFDANVSPDWRAGRGPHGGYLAAMLLRALTETVADAQRAPRSLTIHYARAPEPGPVQIHTAIERAGRSLSTLSARMEQDGKLMALALAAFSVPWHAPEISDLPLPDVEPAEPRVDGPRPPHPMAPPFARHMEFQPAHGHASLYRRTGSDGGGRLARARRAPPARRAGAGVLQRRTLLAPLHPPHRARGDADDRPHDPLPREPRERAEPHSPCAPHPIRARHRCARFR